MIDIEPVLSFLGCRTPATWIAHAVRERGALLLDHASLELKAAQQAQKIIWKYGATARGGRTALSDGCRGRLLHKMSRLAREELRHFEQVLALLNKRGTTFHAVSPSRYAAGLHERVRKDEPGTLIDTLIVGAIIEARSCERFYSLLPGLAAADATLAKFYASLLRAEARHFADYLVLAREAGDGDIADRVDVLLHRDAELILSPDPELRFHSGVPTQATMSTSAAAP